VCTHERQERADNFFVMGDLTTEHMLIIIVHSSPPEQKIYNFMVGLLILKQKVSHVRIFAKKLFAV
jgi:hypothetical protein